MTILSTDALVHGSLGLYIMLLISKVEKDKGACSNASCLARVVDEPVDDWRAGFFKVLARCFHSQSGNNCRLRQRKLPVHDYCHASRSCGRIYLPLCGVFTP